MFTEKIHLRITGRERGNLGTKGNTKETGFNSRESRIDLISDQ